MFHFQLNKLVFILKSLYGNKILWVLFASFVCILLLPSSKTDTYQNYVQGDALISSSENQQSLAIFKQWEADHFSQDSPSSFAIINYEKCIPINQCLFDDCNVKGSRDGKGNFCLPAKFSDIGDWAPELNLNLMGVSLLKNPDIYSDPVEHTQASARLPDVENNAYFMFSSSQNYAGFLWVVEVEGIDPENPEYLTSDMPARVVWWQKLNKCQSDKQCNEQSNIGNFNHPARISRVGDKVVIAFQNYSYTVKGSLDLANISNVFDEASIPVPKPLESSTLPIYPKIRSADAIAFYDVSNPKQPQFVRKLLGDQEGLWGGSPPGRDISEVAMIKVGNYYHINVGGTIYNYDGKGENKIFGANYRVALPFTSQNIYPLIGDTNANVLASVNDAGESFPVSVHLNSVPYFYKIDNKVTYGFTLQLITTKLTYNLNEETHSTFMEKESIFSARMLYGEATGLSQKQQNQILLNIKWQSEACERAWGFQVLENGAYNVICHDINPMGKGATSMGQFLVRGVSVNNKVLTKQQAL